MFFLLILMDYEAFLKLLLMSFEDFNDFMGRGSLQLLNRDCETPIRDCETMIRICETTIRVYETTIRICETATTDVRFGDAQFRGSGVFLGCLRNNTWVDGEPFSC